MKAVIYNAPAGTPTTLVATSAEVTVTDGQAAGWVDFTFAAPPTLPPGLYMLGLHGGANTTTIRWAHDVITGGTKFWSDTYSDGALATATGVSTASREVSIYASPAAAAAAGGELGSTSLVADATVPVVVEASAAVIATLVVTCDGQPVIVTFSSAGLASSANAQALLNLYEDGVDRGRIAQVSNPTAGLMIGPLNAQRRLTPAAGSRTFTVRGWAVTAAGVVYAGAGTAGTYMPATLRVRKA